MHQIFFFYIITIQLLYNNLLLLFHQHHQPAPSTTTIDHHHPSEEYNLTIFDYQFILSYSMIPSAPCISTIRLTHPSRDPPPLTLIAIRHETPLYHILIRLHYFHHCILKILKGFIVTIYFLIITRFY